MNSQSSVRSRRKRAATGPARPRYLADRDLDRMMIMFVALMGEVSALRDRLDTHEALADAAIECSTQNVESFSPSVQRAARRQQLRMSSVRRVFRVVMEELEADESA